jgi:RNA polymerase sigma-70 factor (ECF subfamily)
MPEIMMPEIHAAPPSEAPSDAALVERAQAGEGEAFALLYERSAGEVRRFLVGLRLGLDAGALDDAVQETYLRLLDALGRYHSERAFLPYVLGVARHVALERCRQRSRAPQPLAKAVVSPHTPPEGVALADERRALVDAALGALPPDLRMVLTLRHVNGLNTGGLCEALECSPPTARARLRAAATRFALELRRLGAIPAEVCL